MTSITKSTYIKYHWISSDPRALEMAADLNLKRLQQMKRRTSEDLSPAFLVLLTSLQVHTNFDTQNTLLIPTNKNLYFGKTRRSSAYTPRIYRCLRWLIDNGYLVKDSGVQRRKADKSSKISWLPSTFKIGTQLAGKTLASEDSIIRNPLAGYIDLRTEFIENGQKSKRSVPISEKQHQQFGRMIDETEDLLARYDDLMKSVITTLGQKRINSAMTSMLRIFSRGDLTLGGRLYSPIQNLKSSVRKHIRFNDEPVIEIDYSAIHPSMLYHQKGIDLESDPYELYGYDRNKEVKLAFNIMLNSKSGSSAKTIARELDCSLQYAIGLEKALVKKHWEISEHFNSDAGLRLQKLDSEIALRILRQFVDNQRPVITVHDSAIVSVRDTESLKLSMEAAYSQVMGNKLNPYLTLNAIKAESLDFSEQLELLIERSLNGTLKHSDYSKSKWDEVIQLDTSNEAVLTGNEYCYSKDADESM